MDVGLDLFAPENIGVPLWAVFGPEQTPSLTCVKLIFSDGVGPFVESVYGGALPGMVTMFGSHLPMLASVWAKQQRAVYFRDHGAALDRIRERTTATPMPASEPVRVDRLFVMAEPARRTPDQEPVLDDKILVFRYRRR